MDSLTNPLIQCKNCLNFYRKSNEAEHMQTCIDTFSLDQCPHCTLLFPVNQLALHIQTHHNNTDINNIDINLYPPLPSNEHSDLDFDDLTEEYNKYIEHELCMKKIYGVEKKKKRGFKRKFKSGMKKMGKHIVNFLYRNFFWKRKWATHSSILAWNSMDRGTWQATVHGVARVWHDLGN